MNHKPLDISKYISVIMHISNSINPINDKWHIKFDRDVVQEIKCPQFVFSTQSMNVAITKVADLVARHPENYFKSINIK